MTGPRRAGKTTLLRRLFPRATYVLLEDPDVQARARSDPRALLDDIRLPALLDEIQNAPELFAYIRTRIAQEPRNMGRWLFTGSQEAPLMQGVSESMAGRAAILQLLPFSMAETDRASLLLGGYPEVLADPRGRGLWFSSYIQTYLVGGFRFGVSSPGPPDTSGGGPFSVYRPVLFPAGRDGLWTLECEASKTVFPAMAGPLTSLRRSMNKQARLRQAIVHRFSTTPVRTRALAPGVEALDLPAFVAELAGAG